MIDAKCVEVKLSHYFLCGIIFSCALLCFFYFVDSGFLVAFAKNLFVVDASLFLLSFLLVVLFGERLDRMKEGRGLKGVGFKNLSSYARSGNGDVAFKRIFLIFVLASRFLVFSIGLLIVVAVYLNRYWR
jgi:hypothetical protein